MDWWLRDHQVSRSPERLGIIWKHRIVFSGSGKSIKSLGMVYCTTKVENDSLRKYALELQARLLWLQGMSLSSRSHSAILAWTRLLETNSTTMCCSSDSSFTKIKRISGNQLNLFLGGFLTSKCAAIVAREPSARQPAATNTSFGGRTTTSSDPHHPIRASDHPTIQPAYPLATFRLSNPTLFGRLNRALAKCHPALVTRPALPRRPLSLLALAGAPNPRSRGTLRRSVTSRYVRSPT